MEKRYVGVDIGGTTVKMGLYNITEDDFNYLWEIPTNVKNNGQSILPEIVKSITSVCSDWGTGITELSGIGIGVPGPVNREGLLLRCANLGWGVFSVADEIKKLTGLHNIKVENDANVAALGEMWKGGGRGYTDMILVTLGTGIGGAIIINGSIYSGNNGAAGEIGHMTISQDEKEMCGCGNYGCLEQYASATGIVRIAERALKETRLNTPLVSGQFTTREIVEAAKNGDDFSLMVIDEFARYLGVALSNVANVINPQAFIIGGGVSKGGSIIIDNVRKYFKKYSMYALKDTDFRLAELGNKAGIYGCVKMAVDD